MIAYVDERASEGSLIKHSFHEMDANRVNYKPKLNINNYMDSTTTGALIGAAATIAGAFISRGAVTLSVSNLSRSINPVEAFFLRFFSFFSITSARLYKLTPANTKIDDVTRIILTVCKIDAYNNTAKIRITPPQSWEKEHDIYPGWHLDYSIKKDTYRLTVIKITNEKCIVEIRRWESVYDFFD